MTVAVNDLVDKVELILNDSGNDRWAASELVDWASDGQRDIVLQKPEANVTVESLALVAGTKQSLPTGGVILLDVTRNMGTDGATPGNAIRVIDRKVLDAFAIDWHTHTATAVVKHFMFDDRNPKVFYIYPQSDATAQVEIVYSSIPAACAAGGNIALDDIYSSALMDYVLYRAFSVDADYAANIERAQSHYQAYLTALGVKEQAENLANPNNAYKTQVVRGA